MEDGFALPELGGELLEPRVFTSTYYDTPDRRLALVRVTLRRRVENGRGVWQLKLPEGRPDTRSRLPAGPPARLRRSPICYSR